jgi:hypothetical protein
MVAVPDASLGIVMELIYRKPEYGERPTRKNAKPLAYLIKFEVLRYDI